MYGFHVLHEVFSAAAAEVALALVLLSAAQRGCSATVPMAVNPPKTCQQRRQSCVFHFNHAWNVNTSPLIMELRSWGTVSFSWLYPLLQDVVWSRHRWLAIYFSLERAGQISASFTLASAQQASPSGVVCSYAHVAMHALPWRDSEKSSWHACRPGCPDMTCGTASYPDFEPQVLLRAHCWTIQGQAGAKQSHF